MAVAAPDDAHAVTTSPGSVDESGRDAWRTSAWRTALCIAVYVGLAVAVHWRVWSSDATTHFQIGGDEAVSTWMLRWVPFALGHGQNPLYSDFGNYPFGVNLLVNTSQPLLGLVAAPVTLLFGAVAAFNVLMTLALALSATSGYFLARRLATWRPAAFVGGLLYGFSPYVLAESRVGHLNLAFVALPPLIFLVLHELAVRQRGNPLRWGVVLGLLVIAQFFVATEILTTTAIVGAAALVVAAIIGRHRLKEHIPYALGGLTAAGAVAAVGLAYPVWFVVAGPAHITGAIQLVPQAYRADLLGPVVPDSLQRLAPRSLARVADHFANNPAENGSYLGVPLLVILAVGVVWLRRKAVVVVVAVTGAIAFVLSLGGALAVKSTPGVGATGSALGRIPLPEAVLAKVPLLDNIIPSRMALYVSLAAALVLAVILDELHRALARGRGHLPAPVWPVVVAVVALAPLLPVVPFGGVGSARTPSYFTSDAVDTIAPGSTVVVYPYPTASYWNPQIWQATAGMRFKMPGGYFLVPQGADGHIAFSSQLSYMRTTLTATTLVALYQGDPPPRTPALRGALLAQFDRWHVRMVLAVPGASAHPAASLSFLTWILGRPRAVTHGTYVWYRSY